MVRECQKGSVYCFFLQFSSAFYRQWKWSLGDKSSEYQKRNFCKNQYFTHKIKDTNWVLMWICFYQDNMTSATLASGPEQASNHDEFFMHQTLHFSDNLRVCFLLSNFPFVIWVARGFIEETNVVLNTASRKKIKENIQMIAQD